MKSVKSIANLVSLIIFVCGLSLSANSAFAVENTANAKIHGESVKATTKVNINQASEKELVKNLNGVGASKAKAIIEYREANGEFKSIEELAKVKGIGQKILEKNKERLTI